MRAKDLLPNTIYEVTRISSYGSLPYPGTEFVVTTDDVTPSNVDWRGLEATRTVEIPPHKHVPGTHWDKIVPVKKFVSVYPVSWTAEGYVKAGTSTQMELRHIDAEHLDWGDEIPIDADGPATVIGCSTIWVIGDSQFPYTAPHEIVRTVEQLTENRRHLGAHHAYMDSRQAEDRAAKESSNKVRWALLNPATFALLDITVADEESDEHYYYKRQRGCLFLGDNSVEVMLSLDQIEAIDALVRAAV